MSLMAKKYLIFIFLLASVVFSTGLQAVPAVFNDECSNTIELKSKKDNVFTIQVNSNTSFEAELYMIENGEFIKISSIKGSGSSLIKFDDIEENKTYKIITKFNADAPLCKTRQLSGLTL